MKRLIGITALVVAGLTRGAQSATEKATIAKICGCFEVSLKYAETFSPNADYKFHDREKIGGTAA